ncbi:MAG: malto-oligosyltrehalose trehalohydrolase [Sporichthyaceae bacterium]
MAEPAQYAVWAPLPTRVDLWLDGGRHPMSRTDHGWWHSAILREPGARYGFCLDGGEPRPDPRSGSQPDGVHGLSEVVDHYGFAWTDEAWAGRHLPGSVIYELHIGTFTRAGTFDAAISRLGHLVDLGIDTVELLPVAEFPGRRGWGYDGVHLSAPHHAYGGPDSLKRLVDACHGAGLAVVMDVVYNHLGPAGNYLPEFGPYFCDRHMTMWGPAVNFDGPGSDEVRRWVIDNALMWLRDYHCDGLRLDAVHALVDDSALHLLEQLSTAVAAEAERGERPLFLIAESDRNDPRYVRPVAAGGLGLDAAWADDWHHALHAVLTGERAGYYADFGALDQLTKSLASGWVYDGIHSGFRQRSYGRPPTGLTGSQFVVSVQNHDQVGNRARGDRLGSLTSAGRLRIAAALLLTSPFIPLLFQGEEWDASTPFLYFTDHEDPELGALVSAGRRSEFTAFGWTPEEVPDPQDPDTFTASVLDWAELDKEEHGALLSWYRTLIALRRRHGLGEDDTGPGLLEADVDSHSGLLGVRNCAVWVLANLGSGALCVDTNGYDLVAAWPPPRARPEAPAKERTLLAPDAVLVLERSGPAVGG